MLDASTRVAAAAGSCLIDVHLHCVVDGALESKVLGGDNHIHAWSCEEVDLARRRRARCMCTSRTPRSALTTPRHDVTAALSGLAAQKHEQGSFDATRLHARRCDGAHRGRRFGRLNRYTTATRLDVYSTTHRCVEWPCFIEAKSLPPSRDYTEEVIGKGRERGRERKDVEGRSDANAATIGHQHRAAREAAVLVAETAESRCSNGDRVGGHRWPLSAITCCHGGGQARASRGRRAQLRRARRRRGRRRGRWAWQRCARRRRGRRRGRRARLRRPLRVGQAHMLIATDAC